MGGRGGRGRTAPPCARGAGPCRGRRRPELVVRAGAALAARPGTRRSAARRPAALSEPPRSRRTREAPRGRESPSGELWGAAPRAGGAAGARRRGSSAPVAPGVSGATSCGGEGVSGETAAAGRGPEGRRGKGCGTEKKEMGGRGITGGGMQGREKSKGERVEGQQKKKSAYSRRKGHLGPEIY